MSRTLPQSNDALQENLNPLECKVENKVASTNQNEIVLFDSIKEGSSSIQLYSNHADNLQIEVLYYNETVWLNREQLAKLFGRDIKTIGKHINNALKEELKDFSVVAKFATTKDYGRRTGFTQTLNIEYYNLEMITSIGYRVKSKQGILFRQWANKVLKEYLLRGYAVNQRVNQLEDKIVGTHGSCVREPVAPARSLSRLLSLSKYCRRVVDRREKGLERNDNFLHLNF